MTTATSRINLSAIGKKAEKKENKYPLLVTERAKELATIITRQAEEFDQLKADLDINKADLRSLALPAYFAACNGKTEIPSSMAVPTNDAHQVLVTFTSRYKAPASAEQINELLGAHASQFLKPRFTLELDSEKIPQDMQQGVIDSIVTLLEGFGCADALTAKEVMAPVEAFHTARHTLFTTEQNLKIEEVMPMTVAVKTKGRK